MKTLRKPFLLFLTVIALSVSQFETAFAENLTINSAINKSGRQRMLSQRMAKAYLQISLNVEPEAAKRLLDQSVALFDKQLVELKVFSPTPETKELFGQLERAWT